MLHIVLRIHENDYQRAQKVLFISKALLFHLKIFKFNRSSIRIANSDYYVIILQLSLKLVRQSVNLSNY